MALDIASSYSMLRYGVEPAGGIMLPARDSYGKLVRASGTSDSTTETATKSQAATEDEQLSAEDQRTIAALKKADQQIRQHEMAHLAAAAGNARGGAQFQYERGPDGVLYAVAGEVNIDASPVPGDPEATVSKMRTVVRAALAPADPSSQDRAVAARAMMQMMQSQVEATTAKSNEETPAATAGSSGLQEKAFQETYGSSGYREPSLSISA